MNDARERVPKMIFSKYFADVINFYSPNRGLKLSPRSQMFIIIIFITITQQPEQDRWAENQPTAGLSSLNEYENGMRRSRTELKLTKKEKNACFKKVNNIHFKII